MSTTLAQVAARFARYLGTPMSQDICEHDGMFDRGRRQPMEHYLSVGRSAIDVIARAMIAAEKPEIATVLDLPSGGGRVTRHLRVFFPESEIYVSELDNQLQTFAAERFNAIPFAAARDFAGPSTLKFDLIFVGSLLTHFDEQKFRHALDWFLDALAPCGLLVVTTHGRQHDLRQRTVRQFIAPEQHDRMHAAFVDAGFGYAAYEGQDYGLSMCRPSWLLGLVESRSGFHIVGFQEAGWIAHHDTLVIQRRTLTGGHPII